jgi:hypothetical protein
MVEFPLVGSAGRECFAPPGEIYSGNLPLADTKLVTPSSVSVLAGMWESSTSKASCYARLNVALQRRTRLKSR